MYGGEITENLATGNGGGIHVAQGSHFTGTDGFITNNEANDGGGLYVPHTNLGNIAIDPAFEFSGNVARNGLGIDNPLAETHRARINPSTVTVMETFVDQIPAGSGNFQEVIRHAFTNHDINSTGPQFWRVTHAVGRGYGAITAAVGADNFLVESGFLVPNNTTVTFRANPELSFDGWEVRTRNQEFDSNGDPVDFTPPIETDDHPLLLIITAHTKVIGNFSQTTTTLTISKTVAGDLGNLTMAFDFTVFFEDASGDPLPTGTQFSYTGDATGTLTLGSDGSATFQLSHGQSITIEDVPMNGFVRIIEDPGDHTPSFVDSEDAGTVVDGYDTTMLPMAADRSFSFINDRSMVPPMGIRLGNSSALLLPAMVILLASGGFAGGIVVRRRKHTH